MWYIKHILFLFKKEDTFSRESIDNIIFSLHLALNTSCDKGVQSVLTIPDIEQKRLCRKLNPHLTHFVEIKVNLGLICNCIFWNSLIF